MRRGTPDVMRGILRVQLLVFGVTFVVMAVFTFLPPIALSGLVLIALTGAERSHSATAR